MIRAWLRPVVQLKSKIWSSPLWVSRRFKTKINLSLALCLSLKTEQSSLWLKNIGFLLFRKKKSKNCKSRRTPKTRLSRGTYAVFTRNKVVLLQTLIFYLFSMCDHWIYSKTLCIKTWEKKQYCFLFSLSEADIQSITIHSDISPQASLNVKLNRLITREGFFGLKLTLKSCVFILGAWNR